MESIGDNKSKYTKSELLEVAKPILFNTNMVQAILEGRKKVTRRVVKPQPDKDMSFRGFIVAGTNKKYIGNAHFADTFPVINKNICCKPPYKPGDILYVAEGNTQLGYQTRMKIAENEVEKYENYLYNETIFKPSIHMPKEAARIFLKVIDVRIERLQDITAEQALAEGVSCTKYWNPKEVESRPFEEKWWDDCYFWSHYPQLAFSKLWDSTVKKGQLDKYGWEANPWVWVIEFGKLEVKQ